MQKENTVFSSEEKHARAERLRNPDLIIGYECLTWHEIMITLTVCTHWLQIVREHVLFSYPLCLVMTPGNKDLSNQAVKLIPHPVYKQVAHFLAVFHQCLNMSQKKTNNNVCKTFRFVLYNPIFQNSVQFMEELPYLFEDP